MIMNMIEVDDAVTLVPEHLLRKMLFDGIDRNCTILRFSAGSFYYSSGMNIRKKNFTSPLAMEFYNYILSFCEGESTQLRLLIDKFFMDRKPALSRMMSAADISMPRQNLTR